MGKIRLLVRVRREKKGCYIASVPLRHLKKLADCRKRRWDLKVLDGHVWLILEGF